MPRMSKETSAVRHIFSTLKHVQLFFQHEKQIVKNLTFLSAITNDSTKIVTICLEKDRDRRNCVIRLTSNNNDFDEIMHKFMLIAKNLNKKVLRNLYFVFIKTYFYIIDNTLINNKNYNKFFLFRCIVSLHYCCI